jgi:K+-sensing histidine kinase KdpD
MAYWDSEFQRVRSPILRYGFAVVSVAIAAAVALAIQEYQFRDVELPLLVLVIGLVTWYAGPGPAVVAVLLSTAVFNYLFVEPIYSFYVSAREIPYFLIFVLSAATVASFSAVRRRIEDNLRHARDQLQIELKQRQREAEIRQLNQELTLRARELAAANKELESAGRLSLFANQPVV